MVERATDKLKEIYGEIKNSSHQTTQFLIHRVIDTGVDHNNIINAIAECTPLDFILCFCPLCRELFELWFKSLHNECFADSMISTIEMLIITYSGVKHSTLGKIPLEDQIPLLLADNDKNEICGLYEDVMYQEYLTYEPYTDDSDDESSDEPYSDYDE